MPRFQIIAGLDVGTTKVCLAVARKQFGCETSELLGCYALTCDCLRAGTVVDLPKLADAVSNVLDQAQEKTGQRFSSAYVNVAGMHITADNVRGKVNLLSKENEISKKDLDAAYQNARLSLITYDRESVSVVAQNYFVDGQGSIKNPVGLFGSRLEVDYLFVTGSTLAIENLCKAVNMGGLEIEQVVLSNLASSFSVLSPSEKDLGAILVDIGGSITEVAVFTEGFLRYDKMLGEGAQLLTQAIAADLKVRPDTAAKILKNYCRLSPLSLHNQDENILIKEISPPRTITQGQLRKIIEPQISRILAGVKEAINASNYSSLASSGVVLMGGISTMDGLAELAETVFNMPTRVGMSRGSFESSYAAAMGLVEYGCQKKTYSGFGRQLSENMFTRMFQAAKDFIYDYF